MEKKSQISVEDEKKKENLKQVEDREQPSQIVSLNSIRGHNIDVYVEEKSPIEKVVKDYGLDAA